MELLGRFIQEERDMFFICITYGDVLQKAFISGMDE